MMQTFFECLPCFIRQTLNAVRAVSDDVALHERVLRRVLQLMSEMRFDESPAAMGRRIHRLIREAGGVRDPYHAVKQKSNAFALELYPRLQRIVEGAADPFATAVRLAILGNVLDFGVFHDVAFDDVARQVENGLASEDDGSVEVDGLRDAVQRAGDILYIGDNAGEIVFDRLLIEQMPVDRVTLAVRGRPIINDATREDAAQVGLTDVVEVIDDGADAPGTILAICSPTFRERFERADLVIAKGQGNYETLSDCGREVFFLLKAKCPVLARDMNCALGTAIVYRNQPAPAGAN